jgi:hypothetical protein
MAHVEVAQSDTGSTSRVLALGSLCAEREHASGATVVSAQRGQSAEGDRGRDGEDGGAGADPDRRVFGEGVGTEELAGDRGDQDSRTDRVEAAVVA